MFWEPLVVAGLMLVGRADGAQPAAVAVTIALSMLVWLIPYLEMGVPFYLAFLYPFTILANMGVAFRSLFHSLAGRTTWKGRVIRKPQWKWF